jgi:membrane protein implicated in regulation of membrane protease activity
VIVELLTGTFYLLMPASLRSRRSLASGFEFPAQALVAAAVAAAGCYGVYEYRARNASRQMAPVDAGQPANFESWIDQGARLARVRYRGASWEARVSGDATPEAGGVVYVLNANGNTLGQRQTPRLAGPP